MPPARRAMSRLSAVVALVVVAIAAVTLVATFADARLGELTLTTVTLAAGTCLISVPVGTLLAVLVTRTDMPGRGVTAAAIGLLLFVPLYVQVVAWRAGFDIHGVFAAQMILRGMPAAIWIHAVAATPWVVLLVGLGLRWIEPELEQQALLHAGPLRVFCSVTLPHAAGWIVAAVLWVAVTTAGQITVTDLFQVRTLAEEVFTQFRVGPAPGAAALGLLPGVVISAVFILAALLIGSRLAPSPQRDSTRGPWTFRLGAWRWPATVLAVVFVVVLLGVPVASLIGKAGIQMQGAERTVSWSLAKCLRIVAESPVRHARELGCSAGVAMVVATTTVMFAVLLAWRARSNQCGRWTMLTLVAVCLAVPGPLVGLSVIWLLNRPEVPLLVFLYDQSIAGLWLAQSVKALPICGLIVWHAVSSVGEETLGSAETEGAGSLVRLIRITLPMRISALGIAWVASLVLALGELDASILVAPPGATTLPILVSGWWHYGIEDRVAGICLFVLIVLVVPALLIVRWGGRQRGV